MRFGLNVESVRHLLVCPQSRQQDLLQQQSQTHRLDQLELQLQALAAKTEVHHIYEKRRPLLEHLRLL